MVHCPGCNRSQFKVLVPRALVLEEMELRRRFFADRLEGPADDEKDRVEVAHAAPAEILVCESCGILVRHEDAAPDFESDPYAPYTMERMLRAHIDAYRRKSAPYRSLLPPNAKVVEAGSYIGGFLHVAAEWGWNAIGVDVGGDTEHFARSHGYRTRNEALEVCGFEDQSFDAVFNWNCFEQLGRPGAFLSEARRILLPLGHANLLGFPHLHGFDAASLHRIVAPYGFVEVHQIGDRHIMPSLRPLNATAVAEARRVEALVPLPPWFEVTFSRAD